MAFKTFRGPPINNCKAFQKLLALYIHIPFCRVKCDYCDFYSMPMEKEIAQKTIEKIIHHISFFLRNVNNPSIKTVYIGGGTPNCLPTELLEKLLSFINKVVLPLTINDYEFTIELNPDFITKEQLALFRHSGINRCSVGVQTLQDILLSVIGRKVTPYAIRNGLSKIASIWEKELNIDIINGIPGQNRAMAVKDVNEILSYHPDHVSLYTLSVEPETPLSQRLNATESALKVWNAAENVLLSAGFHRYEISNFALPQKECKHNLHYWHILPYGGCGPAAVSTMPQNGRVVRIQGVSDISAYLCGNPPLYNGYKEFLQTKEFLFEHLMMGLRLTKGIDLKRIEEVFSLKPEYLLKTTFAPLITRRLLQYKNSFLSTTQRGMNLLNPLLVELLGQIDKIPLPSTISWP